MDKIDLNTTSDLITYTIEGDNKPDSDKIELRANHRLGMAVFAKQNILKDEFICGFYGMVYVSDGGESLPEEVLNHAIQFDINKFRDSAKDSITRYANHSCEPNCGINGLFDLVAMRDISAGEELVWDYSMSENIDWTVPGGKCLCQSKSCRGTIPPYRDLPKEIKAKYENYTSDWIKKSFEVK